MAFMEGAVGTAASQTAGQVAQDSILGSVFNPAMIQSTEGIIGNAMSPTLANAGEGAMMDSIFNTAAGSTFGNTANNALQQGAGNIFGVPTDMNQQNTGFFNGLNNFMADEGNQNLIDLGFKGYGTYDQHQARKDAQAYQDANLTMAQDAYNRNVEADEKRQSLNF